jgi:hypothetical protein
LPPWTRRYEREPRSIGGNREQGATLHAAILAALAHPADYRTTATLNLI